MELHIRETLLSALDQTVSDIEVLVVDDCSTDSTSAIVRALAKTDSRIKYIRLERNSNLPAIPRNVGIDQSRSEFIAFLDHDDLWGPRKLERQLQVLRNMPEVGLVHTHLSVKSPRNPFSSYLHVPNLSEVSPSANTFQKRNPIMTSSVVVRRSVLDQVGVFSEDPLLRTVEDFHLWLRVARGSRIVYLPEIHGIYRAGAGASMTEDLRIRLSHVDDDLGTTTSQQLPSRYHRYRTKFFGWPGSAVAHFFTGRARLHLNLPPQLR